MGRLHGQGNPPPFGIAPRLPAEFNILEHFLNSPEIGVGRDMAELEPTKSRACGSTAQGL
jgi:hypothetical protein